MSPSAASTIRFFAIVHFDFELRHFIIESPDFSDLHETCQKFGDIEEVARRTPAGPRVEAQAWFRRPRRDSFLRSGFSSDLTLVAGSVLFGGPASDPTSMDADFENSATLDFTIFDTVSALPVLGADYIGVLDFTAEEIGAPIPLFVSGELSGTFGVDTAFSDPDFNAAFGSAGSLDANFFPFFSPIGGSAVGNDLCNMIDSCPVDVAPADIADFETDANVTITAIPEPGTLTLTLLGLSALGWAALRQRLR